MNLQTNYDLARAEPEKKVAESARGKLERFEPASIPSPCRR
jgi:hypothetical protein